MHALTQRIAECLADNDCDCGERYEKTPPCCMNCHCVAVANEVMELVRASIADPIRELRKAGNFSVSEL